MSGIQKLVAIGNLGKDPETFNGGASFSIAVTEKWKKDGQQQERTEWINCTAFGRLGEVCAQYLTKGSKVYIEGKLNTDQFEKDGQKHYRTKVIVREMQMLDSRGDSEPSRAQGNSGTRPDSYPPAEDFEDSIPF